MPKVDPIEDRADVYHPTEGIVGFIVTLKSGIRKAYPRQQKYAAYCVSVLEGKGGIG